MRTIRLIAAETDRTADEMSRYSLQGRDATRHQRQKMDAVLLCACPSASRQRRRRGSDHKRDSAQSTRRDTGAENGSAPGCRSACRGTQLLAPEDRRSMVDHRQSGRQETTACHVSRPTRKTTEGKTGRNASRVKRAQCGAKGNSRKDPRIRAAPDMRGLGRWENVHLIGEEF